MQASKGASFERWNHTAAIEATLANTVRDPKRRRKAFIAADFHPNLLHLADRRRREVGEPERRESVSILKAVFVDGVPIEKIVEFHGIEG